MARYLVTIFDSQPTPTVFTVDELNENMPTPGLYSTQDGKFVVAIKEIQDAAEDNTPE